MRITYKDIKKLEQYTDALFRSLNIDTKYSRHFIERVNHERNGRPIEVEELKTLFKKVHKKYGPKIAQMGADAQGVLNDMASDINVPFALNWDSKNKELDLVGKTVMRKKDFKTSNRKFKVEELTERELTPAEKKKKEEIVLSMKKNSEQLKKKHGEDWKSVMYATATKKAKESVNEAEEKDKDKDKKAPEKKQDSKDKDKDKKEPEKKKGGDEQDKPKKKKAPEPEKKKGGDEQDKPKKKAPPKKQDNGTGKNDSGEEKKKPEKIKLSMKKTKVVTGDEMDTEYDN